MSGERCICELCECGNHRCPHENAGSLFSGDGTLEHTEYGQSFVQKRAERERGRRPQQTSLGRFDAQFDTSTTHLADFQPWSSQRRVQPVKPTPGQYAAPNDQFNSTTTHRTDFLGQKGEFVRASRPQTNRRVPDEAFNSQTTNRVDFVSKKAERTNAFRPETVVYQSNEPLDGQTVHRQDYKAFGQGPRALATRPISGTRHLSNEPFDASTEHRTMFDGRRGSYQRVRRPDGDYRPPSGALDAVTTYKEGYTNKKAERPLPQRPPTGERPGLGQLFDGTTTHKQDFTRKEGRKCPAGIVLAKANRDFEHFTRRDGHRFYRKSNEGTII